MNELTTPNMETQLLKRGDRVAWAQRSGGKTVGLSSIHRANGEGLTYCTRAIPPYSQHLELDFPIKLNVCRRCEALNERAAAYEKQQEHRGAA
jgi:hypothetical protein